MTSYTLWATCSPHVHHAVVDEQVYVKIAIGRDYHDVPPTRGTYQGGGTETLTVAVSVRAIE
jgi:transglutaminase-like putative cysteine protease